MRHRFSLTSFLLGLSILMAPAAAPARPDFSGRWELDAAKSEGLPPDMKQSMTVKQTGDRLEVETKISSPQGDRTVIDTYTLDGKPAEFTPAILSGGGNAKKGTRTATWSADGTGMDITEEAAVENSEGTDTIKGKRTWRLSEGGKVLTIEIDLTGKNGAIKSKRLYRRLAAEPLSAVFPATPPGKLMKEWAELVNASDAGKLAAFIQAHYASEVLRGRAPAEIVKGQLGIVQGAKLELAAVETSSATDLAALFNVNAVLPKFLSVNWKINDSDPEHLVASTIGPGAVPRSAKLPIPELTKDLDAKLAELTRRDEFSGAVLIAKDGAPLWQKAYGMADRERKLPATVATRFRLGSMNKMFTSVAIAQLVDAGKLKFTDTLATVLPDYPNKEVAQKVTVHQLLTHTSGLADVFNDKFRQTKDNLHNLQHYLQLFVSEPLEFQPGVQMRYSNAGFIVLGLIVEKLSGESYYDYVQHHIYEKAAMTASGDVPKSERREDVAVGYLKREGKLEPNWPTLPAIGSSAGGGDSTVGDLVKFATALRTNKLCSAATTDTITTGKVDPGPGFPGKYAYGFDDSRARGHRVVGHGGGAPGMNGVLNILWDEGYTVVALANLDPHAAEDVARYIVDRLP